LKLLNKKAILGTKDGFLKKFGFYPSSTIKLPGHPQNPNFFYEVIGGLTNAKNGDRWIILN
jgi:hypothetical protein